MSPENKCPNQYCEVALKLEEIHGEIKSQLSAGSEIMKSLAAAQKITFERMEQLLDRHEKHIDEIECEYKERFTELDKRINALERKTWWAAGAAAALSFSYTTVMSNLKALMHGGGGGG